MEPDDLEVKIMGKIVAATVFANDGGKAFNASQPIEALRSLERATLLLNDAMDMIETEQ